MDCAVRVSESPVDQQLSSDEAAGGSSDYPYAIQCLICNRILSDSYALTRICTEGSEPMLCFAAAHVSLHIQSDALRFSTETGDFDIGCSYFVLTCGGCETVVGRFYFSTPLVLDFLRYRYCIGMKYVSRVQLGVYGNTFNQARASDPVWEKCEELNAEVAALRLQTNQIMDFIVLNPDDSKEACSDDLQCPVSSKPSCADSVDTDMQAEDTACQPEQSTTNALPATLLAALTPSQIASIPPGMLPTSEAGPLKSHPKQAVVACRPYVRPG